MNIELTRIKEKIVFDIFNFENENRRDVSDIIQKSNSLKYYQLFEELYSSNSLLLTKALTELSNIDDSTYECLDSEIVDNLFFCRERIILGVLRICVCFDIETENIREPLKKILDIAIDKVKSNNWKDSHTGFLLYQDILQFFSETLEMSIYKSSHLYCENKEKLNLLLSDFMSISDVENIETAILYEELYKYKMVSSCPLYIRQTIRMCLIFDRYFVTIDAWEKYFSKYSYKKICKDILLFKQIGFVNIPNIIEKITSIIQSTVLSSESPKKYICCKVIKRFRSEIEQAMVSEPFRNTVDNFLCNCRIQASNNIRGN